MSHRQDGLDRAEAVLRPAALLLQLVRLSSMDRLGREGEAMQAVTQLEAQAMAMDPWAWALGTTSTWMRRLPWAMGASVCCAMCLGAAAAVGLALGSGNALPSCVSLPLGLTLHLLHALPLTTGEALVCLGHRREVFFAHVQLQLAEGPGELDLAKD